MRVRDFSAPHHSKNSDPKLPSGTSFCRCSDCGEYFMNEPAFDRHRIGSHKDRTRACQPTPQLPERGLERDPRGYWRLPKREFSRSAPTAKSDDDVVVEAAA